MLFLIVLATATAAAAAMLTVSRRQYSTRQAARAGMALAMVVAGVTHWLNPTPFIQHLPPWLPLREELVLATGIAEVALGVALLLRQPRRRYAGFALAAYLVAVFPGNLYVALADVDVDGQPGGAYPWLRLPLQLLFIGWALWSTQPAPTSVTEPPPARAGIPTERR
jgi:uncharacterized membrane protein